MCLVFKTTYVDMETPLREGAFFFTRTMLFPLLDKRNTRDKAKGWLLRSLGSDGWRSRSVTSVGCCFVSKIHDDISLPYRCVSEEERGCL